MISLALLVGLLGVVPAASGVIFILGGRWLPRMAAAIWGGLALLFCLVVALFFVSLLSYDQTIQATVFAPDWARWLQLSYQVDAFNVFSSLVIGVLASAVVAILIAVEPVQSRPEQPGQLKRQERIWQAGVLLICLGAIFTLIFANSALWIAAGWGIAGLCAFALYTQGQSYQRGGILLAIPVISAIVLYLALLPATSTLADKRLDLLNGLGREPLWAALLMLLALLAPGASLLAQQAIPSLAAQRPASMGQSAAYALIAAPATFIAFSRLALLIAGAGAVKPGTGSLSWQAFSLIAIWASAALALTTALLAIRHARRASLPLFLSIQLLSWTFAAIAVTGAAALNGALMLNLLGLLALGALLLAGGCKPTQPILSLSWWLAALALSGFPFFASFSSAWLITSNAIAAGPAWAAGIGVSWLALLLATLAMVRAGSKEPTIDDAEPPGATSRAESGPSFLMFLLALLALAMGIAPEVVLNVFTRPAAALPVISSSQPPAGVQTSPLGLSGGAGQWLPGLFWLLALVLLALTLLVTRHERQPASVPPFLGGEASTGHPDDRIAADAANVDANQEPEAASRA